MKYNRNLWSLLTKIQIAVYIVLQMCKVPFLLGSILWTEISSTNIELVFSYRKNRQQLQQTIKAAAPS